MGLRYRCVHGHDLPLGGRLDAFAAAAAAFSFDCYLRPGAVLLLVRRSGTPPSGRRYPHFDRS
eukprot:16387586-Heterocapsa_arctica.AAC.1